MWASLPDVRRVQAFQACIDLRLAKAMDFLAKAIRDAAVLHRRAYYTESASSLFVHRSSRVDDLLNRVDESCRSLPAS